MTPERILEQTNKAIKAHEDYLERIRVEGVDWTPMPEIRPRKHVPFPPFPRQSYKIRVVAVNGEARTEHDFSILARDKNEAQWLALTCAPQSSLRFIK